MLSSQEALSHPDQGTSPESSAVPWQGQSWVARPQGGEQHSVDREASWGPSPASQAVCARAPSGEDGEAGRDADSGLPSPPGSPGRARGAGSPRREGMYSQLSVGKRKRVPGPDRPVLVCVRVLCVCVPACAVSVCTRVCVTSVCAHARASQVRSRASEAQLVPLRAPSPLRGTVPIT